MRTCNFEIGNEIDIIILQGGHPHNFYKATRAARSNDPYVHYERGKALEVIALSIYFNTHTHNLGQTLISKGHCIPKVGAS